MNASKISPRYVVLESDINYDWDDYYVWGAVFYDTVEKTIVTDQYGHGSTSPLLLDATNVKTAIGLGITSAKEIIDVMVKNLGIGRLDPECVVGVSNNNPVAIPCKVVGGRKYKGDAILMYGVSEAARYGLARYQHVYYTHPVVLTPAGDEVRLGSFSYLEFSDDVKNTWNSAARQAIEDTIENVLSIAHLYAYRMSYSACDTDNFICGLKRYSAKGCNAFSSSDVVTKHVADRKAAEEKAFNEFKATKMPELIDWVKTHTDKEGDAIEELAERIFYKHYGNMK